MVQRRNTTFDFENAEVGQPGPDGTPITAKYINRLGIPTIETKPRPGFRSVTVPLSYLYRRPLVRITPPPNKEPEKPKRRPAKVAQMLALAHQVQDALDRGEFKDRARAARKLGCSPARVGQILDLTLFAPDIQAEVLEFEAIDGVEPIGERALSSIVGQPNWNVQRRLWARIQDSR
jgi:hypothetical protein